VFDPAALRARLARVRERIARAAGRAGRDPQSIRLIAVSKGFSADAVRAAAAEGQLDFGENKVQEALDKIRQTSDLPLKWHLIGHLQSNKARKAAQAFQVIQSVDRSELVERIDSAAAEAGRSIDLLVQVDMAGEPTKHGAVPDDVAAILADAQRCRAARVTGLMLLPPAAEDAEVARPYFVALRKLRDDLVAASGGGLVLRELSMGMSHDFEIAIEEGATMVRVGTAIFGERLSH
jgi:pyridoxal phosphate enzyme (YggS family)